MAQTYVQNSTDDVFDFFEMNNTTQNEQKAQAKSPMIDESAMPNDALTSLSEHISQLSQNIEIDTPKEEKPIISVENHTLLNKERRTVCPSISILSSLFETKGMQKIYIQNYKKIYIETNNRKEISNIHYDSEQELENDLNRFIDKKVEQRTETPYFGEILLPGGIMLSYILPPLSAPGISATFVFPNKDLVKGKDFTNKNILNKEMLYFLERCIRSGINILVTGNCHETQVELLNLLNSFITETESVVSIDGKHELTFSHDNVSVINANIAKENDINAFYIAQQLKPDRIALNELNAENIEDFLYLSAMTNKNCTATLYANSPKHACMNRIPLLYKTALNTSKELEFLPAQINEALQIIVHITKVSNGEHKVTSICHVDGLTTDGNVNLKEIFLYNKVKESFEQPGYVPKKIIKLIKDEGISFDDTIFQKSEGV